MTKRQRATQIVQLLERRGFEAFFVGGSVRDMLLGTEPKDFDIATSAPPEAIVTLFPKHVPIGKQFGVILVTTDEGNFEVATFRSESDYQDRRRPNTVTWANAESDVKRRDFTINGLLYNPTTDQVIDYVDGQRDLTLRLIRAIGDAQTRLHEDPLRVLRAIRLRSQLGFQYDKATYDAIVTVAPELHHVSAERVRDELNAMLDTSQRHQALQDLENTGVLGQVLPELASLRGVPQPPQYHQEGDVLDHSFRAVGTLPPSAPLFLVWSVLLHDVGKPATIDYQTDGSSPIITTHDHARVSAQIAQQVLRRLKFPRTEIETVVWLIEHHMSLKRIEEMRPARREAYVLDPRFPWLLELHKADASGTTPTDLSLYAHDLTLYTQMKHLHGQTVDQSPPLLVDGHLLQDALGIEPGPRIGEVLEQIRDAQLAGQIHTKQEALDFAAKVLRR